MTTTTKHAEKEKYVARDYGKYEGKTIAKIRPLTLDECEDMAWDYDHEDYAVVVFFTDGTAFIPMADAEGNGAGFLAEA